MIFFPPPEETRPLSKHSVSRLTPARLVLGFAAAILVALVGWVAVRAGASTPTDAGGPVIVQPSVPAEVVVPQAVEASLTPSFSVSPSSPSPSVSRSPSPTPSKSRKPKRSPSSSPSSTAPSPSRSSSSPPPAPVNVFDATYTTTASWRDGLIGSVRIVNNGSAPRDWTVTITYSGDLSIRGEWNGRASASGSRVTLSGGPLAPGASVTAGYQASRNGSSRATGCTIGGGSCRVS
ncbi:cellulose binding domain-containing protein [Actinoplanes sp. NPDC051861]|uniref:cellulose binding domain-containing protein n=1 Tax=Actinoplanes sp. NPDC051861 TaxID=3155170 RepID=UPI0034374EFE